MSKVEAGLLDEELLQTTKMASLGTMAGCVAHELNNPLTVISGNAQYLLKRMEEEQCSDDIRESLESLFEYATTCSSIVRGLLAFVRRPGVGREIMCPHEAVEDTLVFLERELTAQSIQCDRRFDAGTATVQANRRELQQVCLNLILNARDAMGDGGCLTIETRCPDAARVELAFADTGPGIPGMEKEHVFEPFFTTKKPGQGTGLGLSVCRQIVEAHGGSIRAEDNAGGGTVIVIELPRSAGEEQG